MTNRSYCFTLNNPEEDWKFPVTDKCRYVVYQWESCPTTGTPHIQGYVELNQSCRMIAMKKILPTAHWEPRMGTREVARAYCMKPESRLYPDQLPTEIGVWRAGQGERSDLHDLAAQLQRPISELASAYPAHFLRYHNGIRAWKAAVAIPRKEMTRLTIYWGPAGSGKSSRAILELSDAYWKPPTTKWWDGYDQHKTVIMDDFNPVHHDLQYMLRLIDRYPLLVETKGGHTQFVATDVIITANTDPTKWYGSDPAWLRRIAHCERVGE